MFENVVQYIYSEPNLSTYRFRVMSNQHIKSINVNEGRLQFDVHASLYTSLYCDHIALVIKFTIVSASITNICINAHKHYITIKFMILTGLPPQH